ncbi:hypothetical protein AAD001_02620 [Colwelliaceae bacterium 6471]
MVNPISANYHISRISAMPDEHNDGKNNFAKGVLSVMRSENV